MQYLCRTGEDRKGGEGAEQTSSSGISDASDSIITDWDTNRLTVWRTCKGDVSKEQIGYQWIMSHPGHLPGCLRVKISTPDCVLTMDAST
jgi:hypothetical protein